MGFEMCDCEVWLFVWLFVFFVIFGFFSLRGEVVGRLCIL